MAASSRHSRIANLECTIDAPEEERASSNPPIVLVHGYGGGMWGWKNFQQRFASRGYTSYAVALPFHEPQNGNGSKDQRDKRVGSYSVETYALYVAALLNELGPCVVVGHSMGGLIAQKLAETQAQLGFVFLSSAPPWHFFRAAYKPLWKHLLRHPFSQIVSPVRSGVMVMENGMADDLVNNRLAPELLEEIHGLDVPDSSRASIQMVLGLVRVDPFQVRSPCLVAGGTADRLIPEEEQRRLAKYYGCPLRLFDRGHMLLIEDGWEEVADGLLAWIEELQTYPRRRRTPAKLELA